MTIYIHIGMHKTGTTSIQKFLHTNFSGQNKEFYYPNTGIYEYGHHNIPWSLKEGSRDNRFLNKIKEYSDK